MPPVQLSSLFFCIFPAAGWAKVGEMRECKVFLDYPATLCCPAQVFVRRFVQPLWWLCKYYVQLDMWNFYFLLTLSWFQSNLACQNAVLILAPKHSCLLMEFMDELYGPCEVFFQWINQVSIYMPLLSQECPSCCWVDFCWKPSAVELISSESDENLISKAAQ